MGPIGSCTMPAKSEGTRRIFMWETSMAWTKSRKIFSIKCSVAWLMTGESGARARSQPLRSRSCGTTGLRSPAKKRRHSVAVYLSCVMCTNSKRPWSRSAPAQRAVDQILTSFMLSVSAVSHVRVSSEGHADVHRAVMALFLVWYLGTSQRDVAQMHDKRPAP